MLYTCICGQEFDNPQKFNRHKADCRIHLEAKGVDYDEYKRNIFIRKSNASKIHAQRRKEHLEQEQQNALQLWISEQHTCEKCGKIMTKKYGSGRFCSKRCANTRCHSEETKSKISNELKNSSSFLDKKFCGQMHEKASAKLHANKLNQYNQAPAQCKVCGKPLSYSMRYRATCSVECSKMIHGGSRHGERYCYKYGYYNGIECDSSYELAFVVYCLSNNIEIVRNTDRFTYDIDGKEHIYLPDFKVRNTYIEIKGCNNSIVQIKANAVVSQNIPYLLLFEKDLKPCIDYCIEKYGKKYWEVLYDKDKPSCNDRNKHST